MVLEGVCKVLEGVCKLCWRGYANCVGGGTDANCVGGGTDANCVGGGMQTVLEGVV